MASKLLITPCYGTSESEYLESYYLSFYICFIFANFREFNNSNFYSSPHALAIHFEWLLCDTYVLETIFQI